ncbi:hypothetical protein [Jidongwangia harbinensis]|uniref:hypothetical protein n=1 Tax=Jidongwangia harbinensis TaxID=2878561 RepID=UPI001CD9C05A|nr:hypothetical protein [Jidongwangia harbinensis]MCA2217602.1 hypothetical protein [Jidongwangia harbinensis]
MAYCDAAGFRPVASGLVELAPADGNEVEGLLARVSADDADESGLAEITSPAFVVRAGPDVVAAAGYRRWPGDTAHVSVLTAEAQDGPRCAPVSAVTARRPAGRSPSP